jgi:hypothetical protein
LTAERGDGPERPRPDRPPPGRVSPEALARSRGDAREGLDWLGRQPEAGATVQYRAARILARLVLFGFFRFRIRVEGREHLTPGGYLLIGRHCG